MSAATARYALALASGLGLAACAGQTAPAAGGTAVAGPAGKSPIASIAPASGSTFHQGDPIPVRYTLQNGETADSVVLYAGGRRIGPVGPAGDTLGAPENSLVGPLQLYVIAYTGGEQHRRGTAVTMMPKAAPVRLGYRVLCSYPHSTDSYTQGLLWHDGALYEGTGLYGRSALMRVDPASGRAAQRIDLEGDQFGEGIALLDGRIYQLTWQNGKCLVYDAASLGQTGSFDYAGEGWGLTADGEQLYMSDGSNRIAVRDPATFGVRRTIQVYDADGPVGQLNELEWIDGAIWANVYLTNRIVVIDPATGAVTADLDLTDLTRMIDRTPSTDVLNGIAHDPQTGRTFLTGKNWNKLFEIAISNQ
ncbi:MAG: glutaminyl-peptide cyclotransferase [Rikenellaceae bacterium]|nr:glutaminyl-peptide cyclotransferase [Rikenellaceae bacterium]